MMPSFALTCTRCRRQTLFFPADAADAAQQVKDSGWQNADHPALTLCPQCAEVRARLTEEAENKLWRTHCPRCGRPFAE